MLTGERARLAYLSAMIERTRRIRAAKALMQIGAMSEWLRVQHEIDLLNFAIDELVPLEVVSGKAVRV